MRAMQASVRSESRRSMRGVPRHLGHWMGVAIAGAVLLGAAPAFAQSCPVGTGVDIEPAGDGIAGTLQAGTQAVFQAGAITSRCNTSRTTGVIPTTGNPGDPVEGVLTPPTFTGCSSSIGFPPTTTTNSTNGNWSLSATCGGQARLHIPRGGAVTRVATCTITVAPNAAIDVPATWTNGSPSTLTISADLPIARSGFGCPNVSTARFTATYEITDTTDPAEDVTVTEVPL